MNSPALLDGIRIDNLDDLSHNHSVTVLELSMAMTQTITCNICGIAKREANHWFTYLVHAGQVTFYPWSEENYRVHDHLCSERCCMTVLSRTLGDWSRKEAA